MCADSESGQIESGILVGEVEITFSIEEVFDRRIEGELTGGTNRDKPHVFEHATPSRIGLLGDQVRRPLSLE